MFSRGQISEGGGIFPRGGAKFGGGGISWDTGLCRVSVLGQTGLVYQPGMKLKIIIRSCQLSKPTVAQISFAVGIFRCENAVFSQSGERVSNFPLERVRNAFRNANAVLRPISTQEKFPRTENFQFRKYHC